MLWVSLVTILAPDVRLKIFWRRPNFEDIASAACHNIGARNGIEEALCRSRGYAVSAAGHEIGARNVIEGFFSTISCANNVASGAWKISLKFVEKMSIFNRIYHVNIVTSGPRNTSKACFVEKLSIALLTPTLWLAALAPHSLTGLHVSIAYPEKYRDNSAIVQSHVKHVLVSTAMALERSLTSYGWVYSQSCE